MSKWITIVLALLSVCALCTMMTVEADDSYNIYLPMVVVAGESSVDDVDIFGIALPLPADIELKKAHENARIDYFFETDRPYDDILVYLNLNWPRSSVDGFIPMRSLTLEVTASPDEGGYEKKTWSYYGRFENNDIVFEVRVDDIRESENGETTQTTFVAIQEGDALEIELPETNMERIHTLQISLLNDPEVDWESVPLPEGRGGEDGEDYELWIDRPALDVATQMNDEWQDAGFTGEIDVDDRIERVISYGVDEEITIYYYLGRFERDGLYYSIQLDAKAEEIELKSNLRIYPNFLSPEESWADLIASGAVPLPTAAEVYDYRDFDEYRATFDMSSDALRAYLNETWPNNGIEGEISGEPQGRWVSDNPLAEQVYYSGRFDDEAIRSAYLVRLFDLAGQEQTIIEIEQLRIEEADALGY